MNNYRKNINIDTYSILESNALRWEKTLSFIGEQQRMRNGLDIGDKTTFTDKLECMFNCSFDNTSIDLDIENIVGNYDIITAFEILEHLYNPLHFLLQLKKALNDNGTIYLSTPLGKPYFLWSPSHFHEIHKDRIYSLFSRAELTVVRTQDFRIHSVSFYFTGIRPLLRGLFEKVQIFELKKMP